MMNRILFILAGLFSVFYFESRLVKPFWLRVITYALFILTLLLYDIYAGRKKVKHLQDLVKATMKGNYHFKFKADKYSGLFRDVGLSIIELRRRLLRYIFEIQVASSQVSAASQQLSINLDDNNAFAQQLYAEAQEMSKVNETSCNNVEVAINEVRNITELLEEVKSTSNQLHSTSRQSKQIIGDSLEEIIQIVEAVNDAQKSAESTVECIDGLNIASREISTMLETVDSIAKQTHLLSLNASIESARAGEHGKGFGVVAEEIRKLADDSKKAVSEIALLVNRITVEIEIVNKMIDGNLKSINRSAAYTKNIEKSLNRIEESYDRVETMINRIIETSEKEYGLAANIDNKINLVETMTKRVSFGFEILYESIHKQKHNIGDIAVLGDCLSGASKGLSVLTEKDDINILETNLDKFNKIARDVIRLIKEEILISNGILFMDPQEHQRILDEFLAKYDFIEAAWTNGLKGKFIYSNPPAGIANAKVREWFQESIEGKEYVSPVYISAITRNPCITVSLPIKSDLGLCIGVIGVDLKVGID